MATQQNLIDTYNSNPTLQSRYTQQQYLDLFGFGQSTPTPAPPSGTTPTPSDYSQFPQFNMSDYARQGLGATPQFGDFNETLNRFFRFQ